MYVFKIQDIQEVQRCTHTRPENLSAEFYVDAEPSRLCFAEPSTLCLESLGSILLGVRRTLCQSRIKSFLSCALRHCSRGKAYNMYERVDCTDTSTPELEHEAGVLNPCLPVGCIGKG